MHPSPHDATDTVIDLHDLVVVLGRYPALAGADLRVDAGEIVLLAGPNGAGKTTLLRACAGLARPVRGGGTVLGFDLNRERDAIRSGVGLVGHRNGLYADLTVEENLQFWGATAGASRSDVAAAATAMAVDGRLLTVPVGRLSAGQRRRVALAVLVVRRAALWLLDEPHAGLDATGRDELDQLLRRAAQAGATVVFSSHELDRAQLLATRTVSVVAGRTEATNG
jgi:heme ABC exporter ATP-binding subunit CcmA